MNEDREAFNDTVPVRRGEAERSRKPGGTAEKSNPNQSGRVEVLQPGHVSGVGRHVPVVYGARAVREATTDSNGNEVGAPPLDAQDFETADQDALAISREVLPSLEKREGRARKLTLVAFATAILVSVLGLCVVAAFAFG